MSQSLAKILVHVVFSTKDRRPYLRQNGYGIFSIGFSQVPAAKDYIVNQEEHHRRISYQDEFRALLQRYEIDYDARYVWD